jgi:dephospho-CoA kinase
LYESRGAGRCDYVIVVSAPAMLQRQRVMRRPGMTAARFDAIAGQQMSYTEKRRRADFVVPTGLDRGFSLRRLKAIITGLRSGKAPPARQGRRTTPKPRQGR